MVQLSCGDSALSCWDVQFFTQYRRQPYFGAVLLTGYLGGAVAAHLRLGDPLFTHVLSGVYGGLLVWGGLYLQGVRGCAQSFRGRGWRNPVR